jgi:hypothetical protein
MTRAVVTMTLDDAEHFTAEERAAIVARYPAHERAARTRGIPAMGSGRVFPFDDEAVVCEPFAIPGDWVMINGLDFGYDHPFAAVCLAWDRDGDVLYVTREYAARQATPVVHAAALRPWGEWIPCAWPHDGLQHDKGSGEQLAVLYRDQGLAMLSERATFEDGGSGVEAGVTEMFDRMQTGRWKVFSTCQGWLGEFRLYHRVDGLIVKARDDRLCASRYAMMMRREAASRPRRDRFVFEPIKGVV